MAKAICSAPYWFFWMILGTYLIMPIFNKWVANSDMGELEYFLVFWLITCIFDYTLGFPFPIKLTYFVIPIGLVVLGYYLRYTERDILNNPYFAVFLILASAITMVAISYFYSVPTKFYTFDRYSIFMSLEVIGVFLLFKNAGKFNIHLNFFENPEGIFRKSAFALAKYSYGIYLIHAFIVVLLVKLLFQFNVDAMMPIELFIIMVLVLTIGIAVMVMAILSRIPYVSGWIGAK
jgi:surface polysaccharide O-acyltransferase-like enzyme